MKTVLKRIFVWIIALAMCVALLLTLKVTKNFGEPRKTANLSGVRYASDLGAVVEEPMEDVTVLENVSYGSEEICRFDVAFIDNGMRKPAIVFVHGDTYYSGSRNDLRTLLYTYAAKGYVTVSVDYGLLPDVGILEQQRFLLDSLEFLSMNAEEYQIDNHRISMCAVSSGAQLATRIVEDIANDPDRYNFHLVGLVVINGITDFATYYQVGHDEQLEGIQDNLDLIERGEEEETVAETPADEVDETQATQPQQTQPQQTKPQTTEKSLDLVEEFAKIDPRVNINSQMPPVMVLHGAEDTVIPVAVGRSFYHSLQSARVTSSMVILNGMGHELDFGRIITSFDDFLLKYV